VKEVIEILRNYFINTPIILGGIYATLYKEHAEKQINADFIYKGHINIRIIHELERIGLKLERITDKPKYWWQMGFYRELPYAPILTSTGCPFKCPYCASSILYESFEQRLLNEIMEEIEALHLTGVRDFAFYDDALLYKSDIHIKPLLKKSLQKIWISDFILPMEFTLVL